MGEIALNPSTSKEIKINSAEVSAQFSTTNATMTDVTNATVSVTGLNAAKTYDLIVTVSSDATCTPGANNVAFQALDDASTVIAGSENQFTGSSNPCSITGRVQRTGAATYSVKVQIKSGVAGQTVYWNFSADKYSLTLMAVEV